MRVLCLNLPAPIHAELLALGAEVVTPETYTIQAPTSDPFIAPEALLIHRDQPAPGRANVIPANLIRRPKR